MRKMIRLIAVVAVVLMATAGCGARKIAGSGQMEFGTSVAHPRPALPEEVHQNSKQGAVATARYWLDTTYYGIYTGDTGPLRDISLPGCTACEGTEKTIDQTYKRGARNEGENIIIKSDSVDYFDPGKIAVISFQVRLGNSVTIEADGHQSGSSIPREQINQIELHWMDSQWKVADGVKPKS